MVIGNGPSLRGFDFESLKLDTLGMNAAYRHWDRIGWYPTFYCCLDDQLVQTHHEEIKRLVQSHQVKQAFVEGSFFEIHPECLGDPRYVSLDQFIPYWHKVRGSKLGLDFIKDEAFDTTQPDKITTGAYAVRFASYLGYRRIGLIGIDLTYIERLPGSVATEGVGLQMASTPEQNPNYFFDDYQRAGDRYNIPNPDVHQGDLHLASFKALRDDYASRPVDIINCNAASALARENVFPTADVQEFLGTHLGAIVIPTNLREREQILSNFELWSHPAYLPGAEAPIRTPLVFVFNNRTAEPLEREIRERFASTHMERFFSYVDFQYLDLEGHQDAYHRSYTVPTGREGYKAGPNNQFFRTIKLSECFGKYIFLMETDCIPIRAGWLSRLKELCASPEDFYVLGSAYRGKGTIGLKYNRHLNGNAIYGAGIKQFQNFVDTFWEPELRRMVANEDRRIAYDCLLELLFTSMESDREGDAIWPVWQSVAHLFRYTSYIQNISADRDIQAPEPLMVSELLKSHKDTYIVHSQVVALASRTAVLSGNIPDPNDLIVEPIVPKLPVPPAQGYAFNQIHPFGNVRRERNGFILPQDCASNYILCVFSGSVAEGDQLQATIEFEIDRPAKLMISLNRHGAKEFEGTNIVDDFVEGKNVVSVRHIFVSDHEQVRVQVGSVEGEVSLGVHEVSITAIVPEEAPQ